MEVRLSVIIPMYNVEKYIDKALDSIFRQDCPGIEVILVNDGSTDDTLKKCKEIISNRGQNNVTVVTQKNNGASAARNLGIKLAKGRYLTFVDADDWWEGNEISTCLDQLEQSGKDLLIHIPFKWNMDKQKKIDMGSTVDWQSIKSYSYIETLDFLEKNNLLLMSACNKIIKRSFLLENQLYFLEGTIAEDIEWGIRVYSCSTTIEIYEKKFYSYLLRKGSVTSSITEEKTKQFFDIFIQSTNQVMDLRDEIKVILLRYLSFHYFILVGQVHVFKDKKYINQLKKYTWFAEYAVSGKGRKLSVLYKFLGLHTSSWMIYKLLVFQNKRK